MRRMAMTRDGRITYCSSPDNLVGKGRCNHVAVALEGETAEQFRERFDKENKIMKIENISKYDFTLPEDYFDNKSVEQVERDYILLNAVNLRLKKAIQVDKKYFYQNATTAPDPKELEVLNANYSKNLEAFNNLVAKYKEEHPDYYETIPCQKTYKPSEDDKKEAQDFVNSITSPDARCYWYFKTKSEVTQYKSFMKDKPSFMTTKRVLKAEKKEEYESFQKYAYEVSGYPGTSAINAQVKTTVPSVKYVQARDIELDVPGDFMDLKIGN